MKIPTKSCLLLIFLLSASDTLRAQVTAFSYNGRLNDGGIAANGNYDMKFTLYDAASGGNVVAGPITSSPVAVNSGLFALNLDFGAGVFTGPARWLEVAVRRSDAPNFSTLTPRQGLTSSPYAIYANTDGAVAADSLGSIAIQS